jgi:pilus assembly protein CpaC
LGRLLVAAWIWLGSCVLAAAAEDASPSPSDLAQQLRVTKANQRLELSVNTSRVLTLDNKIPRLYVSNPEVLRAAPISPNQIQISGLQAGLAQLNLWDDKGALFTVDVVVVRDVKELLELLRTEFPEANLRVRLLNKAIYITGYVPRPELVEQISNLVTSYYPDDKMVNGITVGGVQQVALHVKVMEVSRTKLRQLGLDWTANGSKFNIIQGVGQILGTSGDPTSLGAATVRLDMIGNAGEFIAFLQALREQNLVKLLAEPTLVTMTGRPASCCSGGKLPILSPNGLGTVTVKFEDYGTRVDFVPIVLGNGNIRLEVRPEVSEPDDSRGVNVDGIQVPRLTSRWVDTAVEMKAGQTLALAGLIQSRVEATNRGIPYLGDLPWIGRAFSRVEERRNEVELLIVVTPELIGPLDPHQVPPCGPGQLTTSPNGSELYWYGYIEPPYGRAEGGKARGGAGKDAPQDSVLKSSPVQDLGSAAARSKPAEPSVTPAAPAAPAAPAREQRPPDGPPLQSPPSAGLRIGSADPPSAQRAGGAAMRAQPQGPPQNALFFGPVGYDPLR